MYKIQYCHLKFRYFMKTKSIQKNCKLNEKNVCLDYKSSSLFNEKQNEKGPKRKYK